MRSANFIVFVTFCFMGPLHEDRNMMLQCLNKMEFDLLIRHHANMSV